MDVHGRKITVMGLGRHGGGVAAASWLAAQQATVTVTDLADATALAESVDQLRGSSISRWTLGRHDEADFVEADAVVVNPAVRPDHPLLALARSRGVRLTSEIELFLDHCPALVVGVTGSNGKSTTATMLAELLAAGGRRCWLGGNIGISLLDRLGEMQFGDGAAGDVVVLELSSFQLTHLSAQARFPFAAVVTSCTPNHLDCHGSFAAYAAAKRRLVENLPNAGLALLNPADPQVAGWPIASGVRRLPPWDIQRVPMLAVPGHHNRVNATMAAAMAEALGVTAATIEQALPRFKGLAHRCQPAGEIAGRPFIDDSKSTTPESTLAAVTAAASPPWLLLGGQDKGADFGPLLAALATHARGVACFGTAGPALQAKLRQQAPKLPMACFDRLPDAFAWCWRHSASGDTILLSPGCASLDQFRDYHQRAELFLACIEQLRATAL